MTDLNVKLSVTDRRSQALQDQVNQIQGRLDNYLSKLKDDIDKIAGKNNHLFNEFMGQIKGVDEKYEQFGRRMSEQKEFFMENKQRYQDCLAKSEQIVVAMKTQEVAIDDKISLIRDEIDNLDERIKAKDKQNMDMLRQVVEMDGKIQSGFRQAKKEANDFTLEKEDELGGQIDLLRKNL